MYQFVISKIGVVPPFTLCVSHPQTPLLLPSMSDFPVTEYNNTLILIIMCQGDCHDVVQELEYLSDPVVIVSNNYGFAKIQFLKIQSHLLAY